MQCLYALDSNIIQLEGVRIVRQRRHLGILGNSSVFVRLSRTCQLTMSATHVLVLTGLGDNHLEAGGQKGQ